MAVESKKIGEPGRSHFTSTSYRGNYKCLWKFVPYYFVTTFLTLMSSITCCIVMLIPKRLTAALCSSNELINVHRCSFPSTIRSLPLPTKTTPTTLQRCLVCPILPVHRFFVLTARHPRPVDRYESIHIARSNDNVLEKHEMECC